MIVVDTNVIAYLLIANGQTQIAEEVYTKDPDWRAPLLWRSELRNILSYYLKGEHLSLSAALEIMGKAESVMLGSEYEVQSPEVLRLAEESGCSGYDCEFVTLAKELDIPLVSADQKLRENFPSVVVSPEEYCERS